MALSLTLLGLLIAGRAYAAPPRISVLGLDSDSQIKGGIQEATTTAAALTSELRGIAHSEPQFVYTGKPDVAVADAKLSANCFEETASCMAQIAQSLDAQVIVWGSVLKKRDGSYSITLSALEPRTGNKIESLKDMLPVTPTSNDIAALAAHDFSRLLGVAPSAPLRVIANVAGATVTVDGTFAGTITSTSEPFTKAVPLGKHAVTVAKDGFEPFSQTVNVGAQGSSLNAELAPTAIAVAPTGPAGTGPENAAPIAPGANLETPLPVVSNPGPKWRVAFWSGAAVAVGSLVAATAFGLNVSSAENDKNHYIGQLAADDRPLAMSSFGPSADACTNASSQLMAAMAGSSIYGDLQGIQSACNKGQSSATLANVFWGTAVVGAAVAGISYYEGYVKHPPGERASTEARRIRIQPVFGYDTAGLWAMFDF